MSAFPSVIRVISKNYTLSLVILAVSKIGFLPRHSREGGLNRHSGIHPDFKLFEESCVCRN
jgi:hypothetical protein